MIFLRVLVWVGLFFTFSVPVFSAVSAGAPYGFDECFEAALKRSEDLASSEEAEVQAGEVLTQAKGAFLPTIKGTGIYFMQANPLSSTASAYSPPTQNTAMLTATQPLFMGLKEYAGFRQSKDLLAAAKNNKDQAAVVVFQALVTSYFQVLSNTQDLKDLQTEIDYNEQRLKELLYFRSLGRSKESDVLTLQSNIAALRAQVEASLGQLDNARAVFAFVTGLDRNVPLYDSVKMPNQVLTLDGYLTHIDNRPDVRSLAKSALAGEEGITIARAGHIPTLAAQTDYYFTRPGLLTNVNWDFQLTLSIPIFQGGVIQSQVRQAASVAKQNDLALSKVRRQAAQQIESYYKLYQSDIAQLEKQKVAVNLAMKTYDAQKHDYKLGLVTNLDVLQALTSFQESQRILDRARFQVKSDFLQLEASAGMRPKRAIED